MFYSRARRHGSVKRPQFMFTTAENPMQPSGQLGNPTTASLQQAQLNNNCKTAMSLVILLSWPICYFCNVHEIICRVGKLSDYASSSFAVTIAISPSCSMPLFVRNKQHHLSSLGEQ